jgi:hypothetical protein
VVSTPPLVTTQGTVRMVRLDDKQFAKVPDAMTPTFLIDWVSSEDNEEGYNPSYTDALGNVVYCGRIV